MISKLNIKVKYFFKGKMIETKILVAYRYISLIITSTFYLLIHIDHKPIDKIIIIGCLFVSAIILSYLYTSYEKLPKNIMILLEIESIGNIILLIPSGGIKSPFIWYSLNIVLISSIFLKKKIFWFNLIIYLIGYLLLYKFLNLNINVLNVFKEEANLLLSFIMIIIVVQAWGLIIKRIKEESKKLEDANIQLGIANSLIIESMNHRKELYESVNILTNQGNREGIISISFEHIKRITKNNTAFYYDITNNSNRIISIEHNHFLDLIEEFILKELDNILETKTLLEMDIQGKSFLVIPISSSYATYGVLGLEINSNKEGTIYENNMYQLQFLSELISTAFERIELEEVNHRLLITEEQNRIANEIHDSVLQRLFSMSCGIFTLIKKLDDCTFDEIKEELNLFRNTTDYTMKELRDKIYGLSWKKTEYNCLSLEIKRYIDDIKKLNKVNIPFSLIGNIEYISTIKKKALYRMICEGIGNAVRHGKAKNIEIVLKISPCNINLRITDDGIGFNSEKIVGKSPNGLGLLNLYQLTESFQGEVIIKSELEKGTTIDFIIPNLIDKGEKAL